PYTTLFRSLAGRQLFGSRDRHHAGGDGAEIDQGVVGGVAHAHQDAVTAGEARAGKAAGGAADRLFECRIGPALVARPVGWIGGDDEGKFVGKGAGARLEAVAGHVQALGRARPGIAVHAAGAVQIWSSTRSRRTSPFSLRGIAFTVTSRSGSL